MQSKSSLNNSKNGTLINMKNYFITFEGIDGCGKDTQLFRLAKAIKDRAIKGIGSKYDNFWITREPTMITEAGRTISRLIKGESVTKEDATKGFIGDRIEHSQIIKQQLTHSHVLCSRYDFSTLTYQMVQGMDFETLYKMHKFNQKNGALIPDITIIFDLPAEVAFQRIKQRGEKLEVLYEKIDFLSKIVDCQNECIEKLKKSGRTIVLVDATLPIDGVTEDMITKINNIVAK